jgi:hypothetical protein
MFQTTKAVKPICYTQRTSRTRNVSNVLRVAGTCWATSWILEAESKRKAPITWDRRRLKPRGRRGGDMFDGEVNWDMLRSCFGTSVFDRFILSIYFRGQSLLLDVCFGIFVWRVTLSHVQKAMGHHSEGVSLLYQVEVSSNSNVSGDCVHKMGQFITNKRHFICDRWSWNTR